MVGAQRFFPDGQRTLVERFGLGVVALRFIKLCQIVQAGGHIGVIRAKIRVGHFQRFLSD